MDYKKMIIDFIPFNEQEENDKRLMLKYINDFDDVLTRNNEMCHFTVSNWIVNKDRTKVLMAYHNIYKSWAWTGGHVDGDDDFWNVAYKEANEETRINSLKPLCDGIFGIEILTVDPHIKRGKYVSSHLHLDCSFLFEADEDEILSIKEDENSDVGWINIDEVCNITNEEKMKPIYKKLNDKLKQFNL